MSPTSTSTEPRDAADRTAGTSWVRVCSLERLTPDRGVAALVQQEQVAIFLLSPPPGDAWAQAPASPDAASPDAASPDAASPEIEIYAIGNRDPYSGANVMARGLVGSASDEPTVASPIYKQRFSLRDGSCLDGEQSVRSWPVRVSDGWVEVRAE